MAGEARSTTQSALAYLLVVVLAFIAFFPLAQATRILLESSRVPVSASGDPAGAALTSAPLRTQMTQPAFLKWVGRATLIAVGVAASGATIASIVGGLVARRHAATKFAPAFAAQLVPAGALFLALGAAMFTLQFHRSFFSVFLIYALIVLPFCVREFICAYRAVPSSLSDAAALEGCSEIQRLRFVLLPFLSRAVTFTGISSMVFCYGCLLLVSTFVPGSSAWTEVISPTVAAFVVMLWALSSGAWLLRLRCT
ncbi:MAG: hypothetical protein M3Z22_03350 [Verrucomicrobiota bacterium]|nr:hypothetical protein [Verrucomicrobiota bacterium]